MEINKRLCFFTFLFIFCCKQTTFAIWQHFEPEESHLRAVWVNSPADIFSVGSYGKILHYDGRRWSNMNSGVDRVLTDVWGSSSSDVFAVGASGTILHYDGNTWNEMDSGVTDYFSGIWGSSSTDVFLVSDTGSILHYDGMNWRVIKKTSNMLFSVWGSSPTDVFVVGYGIILHYDGISWREMAIDDCQCNFYWDVWGRSSTDVFAVGQGYSSASPYMGKILHYDGTIWREMNSGTNRNLKSVRGDSSSNVFAYAGSGTIIHYDGYNWRELTESSLYDILDNVSLDPFVLDPYVMRKNISASNFISFHIDWENSRQGGHYLDITPQAINADGENINYQFYYRANYGTDDYSHTRWTTVQEYSPTNQAPYTFDNEGRYMVVARAVPDMANEPDALPTVGAVVTIGGENPIQLTELALSTSTPSPGVPMTISVAASTPNTDALYYKFYYRANYGTSAYDTTPWVTIKDYSTENFSEYNFPDNGAYIIVVNVVKDPDNEPDVIPIMGCSVIVE